MFSLGKGDVPVQECSADSNLPRIFGQVGSTIPAVLTSSLLTSEFGRYWSKLNGLHFGLADSSVARLLSHITHDALFTAVPTTSVRFYSVAKRHSMLAFTSWSIPMNTSLELQFPIMLYAYTVTI